MSLPPLLSFTLLADRNLNPAAVKLRVGKGDMSALLPLLDGEDFSTFSATFPCLFDASLAERLPPELLTALQNAGCQIMRDGQSYNSDEQTKPVLPTTAEWLTGDWYCAPPARQSASQATSRTVSLKLLQLVATDADTCEIEAIFRQDPVLAFHLLRLVNSLGVGVGRHISSFSQAILILGRQQLKRWLNLMLFAASRDDHRSAMLLARVAVRARTMELLAKAGGLDRSVQEQAFMAGMFSLLGTLFGLPLVDILKPLRLSDSLTNAVLKHEGELGQLLLAVQSTECTEEPVLVRILSGFGLSIADYNPLSLEAYQWMLGVIHEQKDAVDA